MGFCVRVSRWPQSTAFTALLQPSHGRLHQQSGHRLTDVCRRPGSDPKGIGDIGWIDIVRELAPDLGQGPGGVCHR